MEKVSVSKIQEIEKDLQETYGISREVLMEQAGFHVAEVVREEFSSDVKIGVICGKGMNGGDGFVAARRLLSWGYNIEVYTPFGDEELSELALKKLENVRKIEEDCVMMDFPTANVYLDAVLGYGLEGPPEGEVEDAVRKLEKWSAETISVDVPTGVNPDTGEGYNPHVSPEYTVTLGLPKKGLRRENAGKVYLADVGIPHKALESKGLEMDPLFDEESVIDLESDT